MLKVGTGMVQKSYVGTGEGGDDVIALKWRIYVRRVHPHSASVTNN